MEADHMMKGYHPRNVKAAPEVNNMVGLFVAVSVVVFPLTVLLVAGAQAAIQQPRMVLTLLGVN